MNIARLIGCIALCEGAGLIASVFTAQSVKIWYPTLIKPAFTPPNWVFAPAWITLYLLMGIALYLVWQKADGATETKPALILFFIQLALNVLWSFIFFGMRSPFWGFVEIVVLLVSILGTILLFWKISHGVALLLVPYLLWVSYATLLTYSIWRLNPS